MFWWFFLPSSRVTFQSQSLKISLKQKQRMCLCPEINNVQHYNEMQHKTSHSWPTWFKATTKATGCLQGASQASTAQTTVFLITKAYHGNQITGSSNNDGSQVSKGSTFFPGIFPSNNFLLYRSVNTLPFSVVKCDQWETSTPDNQKKDQPALMTNKSPFLHQQHSSQCVVSDEGWLPGVSGRRSPDRLPNATHCREFWFSLLWECLCLKKEAQTRADRVHTPCSDTTTDAKIQMNQKSYLSAWFTTQVTY